MRFCIEYPQPRTVIRTVATYKDINIYIIISSRFIYIFIYIFTLFYNGTLTQTIYNAANRNVQVKWTGLTMLVFAGNNAPLRAVILLVKVKDELQARLSQNKVASIFKHNTHCTYPKLNYRCKTKQSQMQQLLRFKGVFIMFIHGKKNMAHLSLYSLISEIKSNLAMLTYFKIF